MTNYLPYRATYSGNKDPYLVWDSAFTGGHEPNTDDHYHHNHYNTHTTASLDSHSPASLNHYHYPPGQHHMYPTCSGSSASWPSAKKRKCCGLSCGCCALTLCALTIISALAVIVGFSIYLAMITNLHKSPQYIVNGSFKVDSGDAFHLKLINTSSPEFMRKANKYETIIKTALETSAMNTALTKPEVYAFRKGSLIVYFKLYLDRRKIDTIMDSETARSSDEKHINSASFDDVMAVKLLQRELREGISQLKITGTEQIIIDIKSIQVTNEYMDSMTDNNGNDIKTSGFAATKPLAPIKAKDIKQLSNKSTDIKPKANQTDNDLNNRNAMNITNTTQMPNTIKTKITATEDERQSEPDVRNASNTPTNTTNTANTIPPIVSTLSSSSTTTHSSTATSSANNNETELKAFTSNKPKLSTSPEIKSTPVPPKSEHRNPFLPFTRRQSTPSSVTTPSTPSTNIRITTRSRLRSTTTAGPPTVHIRPVTSPHPLPPTPLPPLPSSDPTNVLLKRVDIKDDILRVSGMDFGDWKPVASQHDKPSPPKPLPPKPIPIPPVQQAGPPQQLPPNQMPHNIGPLLRQPPQPMPPHIPPQRMPTQHMPPHHHMPNRPHPRIPLPIGIPMREVPRLLDTDENEEYSAVTPVEIERHNTSISHPSIQTTTPMSTTFPSSTSIASTSASSAATRSPRLSSTTGNPSLVDGFMVPMSVANVESSSHTPINKTAIYLNDYNRDLRRNKSLNIVNTNPITRDSERDYVSHSSVTTLLPNDVLTHTSLPTSTPLKEMSVGSVVLYFSKSSNNATEERDSKAYETTNTTKVVIPDPNSSSEPTVDLKGSLTKSPFDYFSAINESLFSRNAVIEVIANTTSPFTPSTITSSTHQIIRDINTLNVGVRRAPTSTPVPQLSAGLSLRVDKSDQIMSQNLTRSSMGSSEPLYGERLPKYIPPALYQKYPNNDIIVNPDADEALYDDEIAVNYTSAIDVMNFYALTTTTSHGLETTTAGNVCAADEFGCASGQCIPAKGHCNRRIECSDGSDETQCTCAHHLRAERQLKKICDGIIDCYDMSDEMDCPYCKGSYVCPQSNVCIDKSKVCNGDNDCPNGDDESECISLVPNDQTLDQTGRYFNSEGVLYIRQKGKWAPLCMDDISMNNDLDIERSRRPEDMWKIDDLGKAICRANSFGELNDIQLTSLDGYQSNEFFKMEPFSDRISPSLSMWSSLFEKSECVSKRTTYVKCKNFECGVRPVANGVRRRIIGGQSSSQGSWPWTVALYREGEFQCGGVIIDDQWLLTAAHCFHATREAYWTARFGILRRGNVFASPYEQIRRITHVVVHKDYVDKGFINDIALLRLNEPINYSKHVRPVCRPTEAEDVSKWHRQLCTTVGWGKLFEHGRIFPDTLQEVKLPVISTEECRKRTLFLPLYKITDNMFCAGYDRGGRDACLGDSGGPLMCQKRNGKWFLLGVTSNGDGCGRAGRPGVYTKVAKYMDWIDNVINGELEPELSRSCDGLRCPLGRCLRKEHICNGVMDCRDASDEQNCMDFGKRKSVISYNKANETHS